MEGYVETLMLKGRILVEDVQADMVISYRSVLVILAVLFVALFVTYTSACESSVISLDHRNLANTTFRTLTLQSTQP
jgi:hypothetical protein